MFRAILPRLQSFILRRPRTVLLACGVLTAVALWLGSHVELRTSRSELAPANDPDQQRWIELLDDYKASETVIACVEFAGPPGPPRQLSDFADRLAAELRADPLVERVFHRFDAGWFIERLPYLVPAPTLHGLADGLAAQTEAIDRFASAPSLVRLNELIAARIAEGSGSGATPSAERARRAVAWVAELLRAERALLENPEATVDGWIERPVLEQVAALRDGSFGDGYARTTDGLTLFVMITPRSTDDSIATRRALLQSLRTRADRVREELPGIQVGFTGTPAMSVEEMNIVRTDTLRTSAVAVIGVALLTLGVFRWRSHALLVLLALAIGVVWSFGAVQLELGYLNLITSAFISTLVGVGVAYGIHPVSEYELEGAHTVDPVETVREAYHRTGPAVAAAGLTTSAAFFSILLMRFRGFAELGIVAGFGVLLCLVAALVCLPAILVIYASRRHVRDRAPRRGAVADRLWLERMAERVCRFPLATCLLAALVTAASLAFAPGVPFNTNILDLLPESAESVRYQKRMTLESELSPVFNLVVADSRDELDEMRERAGAEPSIGRFESALRFMPQAPGQTRELLARWDPWLAALDSPERRPSLDPDALARSFRSLESALADAGEDAFTAGLGELAAPLEQAREDAERCRDLAGAADASQHRSWERAERLLFEWLGRGAGTLRRAASLPAPAPSNLPEELQKRFFTSSGRWIGFLYPAGSVFDPVELDDYVGASLRVSSEAIGFPFMFHKMSRRITRGFYRAVVAGALIVMLILLLDLRSPRDGVLAALPLLLGLIWTAGLMRLFGLQLNFANLVAVPLIIGVGIDNGVHVVHRVRLEGREGMHVVLRHTGRAILISSLTTMIGFGSLALASHRGMASLGLLLLIGVGCCLVASTLVLPNLLVLLGIARR